MIRRLVSRDARQSAWRNSGIHLQATPSCPPRVAANKSYLGRIPKRILMSRILNLIQDFQSLSEARRLGFCRVRTADRSFPAGAKMVRNADPTGKYHLAGLGAARVYNARFTIMTTAIERFS